MKERSLERKAYRTWSGIKARCHNPTNRDYPRYGARGVTMCDEWRNDNKAFVRWYKENCYEVEGEYMAVDKDVLGGMEYSPSNCIIIPYKLNGMLIHKENDTRGLQNRSGKWEVKVRNPINGKNDYFGRYEDVEIAKEVYFKCKKEILMGVVREYGDKLPERVVRAFQNITF